MDLYPLTADRIPFILFRVCPANASFNTRGDLCARRRIHGGAPNWHDFDNHLSWKPEPTGLLSYFSSWRRAMKKREFLKKSGQKNVVVIAVWAKDLTGVYSAEEVVSKLGYSDTGPSPRKRLWNHRDEYLVEGGIAADEYRILAIFEGGGTEEETEHDVVFEYPLYKDSAKVPSGFFPKGRSEKALEHIGNEIYRRSGVRDDMKRDVLVKAIVCLPSMLHALLYPPVQYM